MAGSGTVARIAEGLEGPEQSCLLEVDATGATWLGCNDFMSDSTSRAPREPLAAWQHVKRRFDIEFFARTNGITKRQAAELMKKFGEKDHATLVREARWLRE